MSNERRLKGYALVFATFLLGAATGGGVAYASLQHHYARIFRDHPDMMDSRRFGALARKLDLDDQQRERVHGIMQRYAEDRRNLMREMFAQCGDKVRAAQDKLDGDMKATLRPDQLSRYEAIAKERRARFGFGRK
jgi:Spy/CpxP family protein refolding chaperone